MVNLIYVVPLHREQQELCLCGAGITGGSNCAPQIGRGRCALGGNQPADCTHLILGGRLAQSSIHVIGAVLDQQLCDVDSAEAGADAERSVEDMELLRTRREDQSNGVDIAVD